LLGVAIVLLARAGFASGQESTTGSIAGQVVDDQGAPIPGATITIGSDRGDQSLVSDASGRFFAPYLIPGP
jgi:hypothetical protein